MKLFGIDSPLFRTLGKLADLMILNLVFLICCLPIVTIGAALTGLNYVTLKMAEDEEGYIVKGFFKSFKQNFVQATICWILMLVIGLVLGLDFYILNASSGTFITVIRVVLAITAFIYLMVFTYLFAVLARFYNNIRNTFRNSLLMAIADLPKTLIMMVIMAGAVILTFFNSQTLAYGMLIWILFGFALVAYCNCFFLKKVFTKYTPAEEEETDPDNWIVEEAENELTTDNSAES